MNKGVKHTDFYIRVQMIMQDSCELSLVRVTSYVPVVEGEILYHKRGNSAIVSGGLWD